MSRIVWEDAGVYSPTVRDLGEVARELGLPGLSVATATFAIRRSVQCDIQAHARSKSVEIGGILVGEAYVDPVTRHYLVDVVGSLPAIGAHGTGTYFKFTSEAWDYISNERARRLPDLVTVGWYHSHPGLGVFYSATDRASQEAFFHHPWNVGLVIDPVSGEIGAFVGRNSARCDDCLVYYDPPTRKKHAPQPLPPSRSPRWVMMACGAGIGSLVAATLAARNRRRGRS